MSDPIITFCSPKGGVGRTTLAANVASAWAREGRRVLAIDLDPQNGLRLPFGIPLADGRGWARATLAGQALRDNIVPVSTNLLMLPFGATNAAGQTTVRDHLAGETDWLARTVAPFLEEDFSIVVDTPAGHSPFLDQALRSNALAIAVLQADAASLPLLPEIESGQFGRSATGEAATLVLNMIDPRRRQLVETSNLIQAHFGSRLLARVRHDDHFEAALAHQQPVADHAPASRAAFEVRALAQAIAAVVDASAPEMHDAA